MSAALRYARILNGLSALISRKSAISRSTRAMATLSNPKTLGVDPVVENPRPAGHERVSNGLPRVRRAVTEKTAAAAGAADLRGRRARALRTADQIVDRRR